MALESVITCVGSAAFGAVIGWYVYYVNRYRSGDVQLSDVTTLVGIIGGGAVTAMFDPQKSPLAFGSYGIGLAIGFFSYLGWISSLVGRSSNFTMDWFLDGRRRRPEEPNYIPGEVRPTFRAGDDPGEQPLSIAPAPQSDDDGTNASRSRDVLRLCEEEWPATRSDCSAFVRDVAARLGVPLTGLADDIVDQIASADWQAVADGSAARAAAERGHLVVAGMKGADQHEPSAHGHVVIVVAGPLTNGRYPRAYWGKLNGVGERNMGINYAWRASDRDRVRYAARVV